MKVEYNRHHYGSLKAMPEATRSEYLSLLQELDGGHPGFSSDADRQSGHRSFRANACRTALSAYGDPSHLDRSDLDQSHLPDAWRTVLRNARTELDCIQSQRSAASTAPAISPRIAWTVFCVGLIGLAATGLLWWKGALLFP